MALSDLAVFTEELYSATTEVLQQQVELFNGASANTILLATNPMMGDFSDVAFYAKIAGGLVRRRNVYGSGAITTKSLKHLVDTMVKVAAGTYELEMDPSQFRWIQRSPEEAGAVYGQQLAVDMLADMLNLSIGAVHAALSNDAADIAYDATANANTGPGARSGMTPINLNRAASTFGDRSSRIAAWVTHSGPLHGFYENNMMNGESLFSYDTINVMRDPFGRIFIMTDSPALTDGDNFRVLGLTPGAVMVNENGDFDSNTDTRNGEENIQRTYQAEWSYNLGVKGYSWDKTNGGKSPTDAAVLTATNWDRTATDKKDLAGVILECTETSAAA